MRIALATDAWAPQTNGVVPTLTETRRCLQKEEHKVLVIAPSDFRGMPCPTCPEIRLAIRPGPAVRRILNDFMPHRIRIATEGPVDPAIDTSGVQ